MTQRFPKWRDTGSLLTVNRMAPGVSFLVVHTHYQALEMFDDAEVYFERLPGSFYGKKARIPTTRVYPTGLVLWYSLRIEGGKSTHQQYSRFHLKKHPANIE